MKHTIAFVTGGFAGEASVSYMTAPTIEKNIDPEKFNYYKIDITPDGWWHVTSAGEKIQVDKNDFSIPLSSGKITFDAVLIGIHGTPGEDGKLQGYFDLMKIPYTSCDCAVSALTFNKRYTVAVAAFAGIPVSNSILLFKKSFKEIPGEVKKLNFPLFIKPNNGGSSIGMSKIFEEAELDEAIQKAFNEDDQVLIEEYIEGREFTVGVFSHKGKITVLPITEVLSKKDFFDFDAKYNGGSEEITPAEISEEMKEQISGTALKIYETFNCKGVVRIDFIYNKDKQKPFMLEINTVPGQTAASVVPQQVKALGWDLKDFYTILLEECLSDKR
ncbi:MAG: D-alanine--D-alanine ligase [Ginsengibacter sp.]